VRANKHRKIEKAGGVTTIYELEREEEKRRKKEHTQEDLSHMRVDHDAEKINAGSTVIMTFKDSRILGKDGDSDILENEQLVRQKIQTRNEIRRGNKDEWDPYGDKQNSLLAKYDDELPSDTGFKLSHTSIKAVEKKSRMSVKEKLALAAKEKTAQSGKFQYTVDSDFMTQEETNKLFGFKKKKKKKKKKKRKLRKRIVEEEDEEEEGEGQEGKPMVKNVDGEFKTNYDFLKPLPKSGNRGSRDAAARLKMALNDKDELDKQRRKYEEALEMEELNSFMVDNESDDDIELQQNLRRSETLAHTDTNQEEASISDLVSNLKKENDKRKKEIEDRKDKKEKNTFTFTTATHFAKSLKDVRGDMLEEQRNSRNRNNDEDDVLPEMEDFKDLPLEERKKKAEQSFIDYVPIVGKGMADTMRYADQRKFGEDKDFEQFVGVKERRPRPIDVSEKKKIPFQHWTNSEVIAWAERCGLRKTIPTLKRLKITGVDMQPTKSVFKKIWKFEDVDIANWKEQISVMTGDTCPDIQLPYIGTDGKPMTMGDAFRSMSHIFHGKKPGKKNTEKRLRHHQEERIRKTNVSTTDTPLGVVDRMGLVMSVDSKPYIILEGEGSVRMAKADFTDENHDARRYGQ